MQVGCKLDESGIVLVSRAEKEWNEQQDYEEEQEVALDDGDVAAAAAAAPVADAVPATASAADAAPDATTGGGPAATAAAAAADEAPKQPKTKRVKVTKKRVVARSAKLDIVAATPSLSVEAINRLREQELEMHAHDRLVVDTASEKNRVEAYVYETREKLSDKWAQFATEAAANELRALLDSTESWLYAEGDGQSKSAYSAKLAEMRKLGDVIALRAREAEERGPASEALTAAANAWALWADNTEDAFSHITPEERAALKSKASAALAWLADVLAKQAKAALTAAPTVLSADIDARRAALEKEGAAVKSKPKPKPKVEEKKPEEKKAEEKKADEAAPEAAPAPGAEPSGAEGKAE